MKVHSAPAGLQRLAPACLISRCEYYDHPVDILYIETIDDAAVTYVRRHTQRQDQITIVLFSSGTTADELRLLEAGAEECFRVSFSVDRLEARLNTLTRRRSN